MKPKWRTVDRFPIQDRMSDLVRQTIKASEQQLDKYRRQLRKMQYGS